MAVFGSTVDMSSRILRENRLRRPGAQPSRTASCRAKSRYGQFNSLAQSAWVRRRRR